MVYIREEVRNNYVQDGIGDVKDTHEVGVRKVCVVYRGLVVFVGLSDVNFGYALGIRRRIYTS